MSNERRVLNESGYEQSDALLADESLSPTFRAFIEIWARKIESLTSLARGSRQSDMEIVGSGPGSRL